jgi:FAD:protein FMN transferase
MMPAVLLLASLVAPPAAPVRLERSLDAMGTTYTIAVYGNDRFVLDATIEDAFEEVRRLDQVMSNYREDSEWSRLNQLAGKESVQVSPETFDLLVRCLDYSRASEGSFDITVGPLMKLWGFYKGTGRVPHRAEIRDAMSRIGWQNIQLDSKNRTVRFLRSGLNIDPGGIGKGYAVDHMADILKKGGVTSGIISAGRSSIYAIGVPPNEPRGWRVAIPHPHERGKDVFEVFLKNESLSTSGTSEKFFVAGGTTYSHIMNPRTGFPAQGMLLVSVVAPKTLDSEAWTKPFFVMGRDWSAQHRPHEFRVFLCEDRSEIACVSLP